MRNISNYAIAAHLGKLGCSRPVKSTTFAEALDSHKPVCARIPVYVIPRGDDSRELSHFDVVLARDPDLEGSHWMSLFGLV